MSNSDPKTVISMGLGAYLAAATERQHYEAEYERECWEVDHCPEREREEIFEVLEKYGISRDGAKGVVDELCVATPKGKERWVRFMMDFELQLQEPDTTAAWKSAATMGLSYFVGGLIPMVPYFVMDVAQQALLVSIAITVVILLLFGYVKSWYVAEMRLGRLPHLSCALPPILARLLIPPSPQGHHSHQEGRRLGCAADPPDRCCGRGHELCYCTAFGFRRCLTLKHRYLWSSGNDTAVLGQSGQPLEMAFGVSSVACV